MPLADVVDEDLRLLAAQLEPDVSAEEVVWRIGQRRPHRYRGRGDVAVVVAVGPEPAERRGVPGVFGRAEIETANAPAAQPAPVDLARHALEIAARVVADDPMA